jgi:nicotinamide riboside kinase
MISRIWFTGSHGTGKTTQLEYFRSLFPQYQKVDMERRDLFEKGIIKINKEAAPWDEIVIAGNAMLAFLSTSTPFISDRSWICKCAYAQALTLPDELLGAWHTINTAAFPGFTDEDAYFYFPPNLPLEDDGVRSIDPEYQKEIDYWVQFYLDYFQIPFHVLEGLSVQDRLIEICSTIGVKV